MSERPRLLIATPDFPPAKGGIQLLMGRLAEHLDGFDVEVVTFAAPGIPYALTGVGLRRTVPRPKRGHGVAVGALNAHVALRGVRHRPDLVLCGYVTLSPACRLLRRLTGVPYAQYVHAEEFRVRPSVCAGAVATAAGTIAVSRHTRDLALAAGAPPERLHLLAPGVDLPVHWSARRDRGAGHVPTIVTVARLDAGHKGHDVMAAALARVAEHVPDVRWVVVGAGSPDRLRAQAARHGVGRRIVWATDADDATRDRWLAGADVFALPSRLPAGGTGGEGFGIAFLEAGAHGLPVVGPDRAGPRDAIREGITGLGVDPEDPVAVAGALVALLTDSARAQAMGAAGRARAEELAWPTVAAAVQSCLTGLLEAG